MKRRSNGTGSITHRKDGRWQASAIVSDPVTGEKKRVTIYDRSEKVIEEKLNDLLNQSNFYVGVEKSSILLNEFLSEWLSEHKEEIREITLNQYKCTIEHHILKGIGNRRIQELNYKFLQKFLNNKKEICSYDVAKIIKTLLRMVFEKAWEKRLIEYNPMYHVKLEKPTNNENYFTIKKISRLLREVNKSKHSTFYRFLIFTGIKEAEARTLLWDDLDLEERFLIVTKTIIRQNGKEFIREVPYNHRERIVKIPDIIVSDLLNNDISKNYVFSNSDGGFLKYEQIRRDFKKITKMLDFNIHLRDLREVYAILNKTEKDTIYKLVNNMGYGSHSTAANYCYDRKQ